MMRKIMNLKTNLIVIGFLLIVSCESELNVLPEDPNTFTAEDFYANPEAYLQGLAGVYSNLSLTGTDGAANSNIQGLDAGTSQYGRGLWNLQVVTSDEAIWSWENDDGIRDMNRSTWTADNVILRGMFGRTMTSIAFANEYLRQTSDAVLDSRGVSGELRNNIQGYRSEVRFLRALSYYHMMDLFGKAAYVTENDPVGAYQGPQYERPELFAFVESELLDIIPQLPDPLQNDYARADKAAAWMVLAKIYLNAEVYINENRYSDCLNYCEQIINGGFTLTPNYLNTFMADNHQGAARQEIVFPVLSDGVVTQNYGPTTVSINGQVGSLEQNGEDFGVGAGGWGGALRVTRQFSEIMLNGQYTNDDRNTIIIGDRPIDITNISNNGTGYIVAKWSNRTSEGALGSAREIVDTDFPMFRLADVYLMYTEAHLRGGGGTISEAVGYVNALRNRANNPITVSPGELDLDLILNERLVELYWEAHRRQDLVRFGKYSGGSYNWSWKGNAPNGIPISTNRDVFPIPTASLGSNPNLTQNDGY